MSILEISCIVGMIYNDVFSINNIESGFKRTRIEPMSNGIFTGRD